MIYADYNGSAPICSPVREYLLKRIQSENFANPSASHELGEKINIWMEKSRKKCAEILGAEKNQILFNSGASEGISHIFYSLLDDKALLKGKKKKKIIISSIEHACVLKTGHFWQSKGYELIKLSCTQDGLVNLDELRDYLEQSYPEIALVSVMAANNETGVIQPFEKIASLCTKYKVLFFSDTTQYIGKEPFHFNQSGIDFAVSSSHKAGGLMGSGLILAKDMSQLRPFIFGGGQEQGLRAGTQNYLANETYGIALEHFCEHKDKLDNLRKIRDEFEQMLKASISDCLVIGEKAPRIPLTSLLAFPGRSGKKIQFAFEQKGIMVTTSSACSDGNNQISHVLKAMGFGPEIGHSVVRISLGAEKAEVQYREILDTFTRLVKNMSV